MREYQYCCVTPKDEDELAYIVDNMESIDYSTFVRNVNQEDLIELKRELGYIPGSLPTLKTDWAVRFGKCRLPKSNKVAYVMVHSAIEYIFY